MNKLSAVIICLIMQASEEVIPWVTQISQGKLDGKRDIFKVAQKILIFPGTRWCGAGDVAENDKDLGKFSATDACCRAHDRCHDRIYGKQEKHGLYNESAFTRMLCKCDYIFYQCLKSVNSYISGQIGKVYFNILANKCFSYEFPIVQCHQFNGVIKRCSQYVLSQNASREWQWFDVPLF